MSSSISLPTRWCRLLKPGSAAASLRAARAFRGLLFYTTRIFKLSTLSLCRERYEWALTVHRSGFQYHENRVIYAPLSYLNLFPLGQTSSSPGVIRKPAFRRLRPNLSRLMVPWRSGSSPLKNSISLSLDLHTPRATGYKGLTDYPFLCGRIP